MKKHSEIRRIFVVMVVSAYAFFFSFAGIVPIVGSSITAYIIGRNKYKNEIHEISKTHFLISFAISELIFLIFSCPIYYILSGFYNPKGYWYVITIALTLNLLLAITSFYLGDYHAKQRKRRGLLEQLNVY